MLVLLVGPKGSGKTHIGRILEERFGVHFLHVEPYWMDYYDECRRAGRDPDLAEGSRRVALLISRAMSEHENVCVETTGASAEIIGFLTSLADPANLLVVRVRAPLDVCLARIDSRDPTHQIPLARTAIEELHELSNQMVIDADVELQNVELTDDDIAGRFADIIPVT